MLKHYVFGLNTIVQIIDEKNRIYFYFLVYYASAYIITGYNHNKDSHGISEIITNLLLIMNFTSIPLDNNYKDIILNFLWLLPNVATLIGNGSRLLSPLYRGDGLNLLDDDKIYDIFSFNDTLKLVIMAVFITGNSIAYRLHIDFNKSNYNYIYIVAIQNLLFQIIPSIENKDRAYH